MPLEIYFQLSLFGKTSWEAFHQATGWILEPCSQLSRGALFQCLLPGNGQMPEWLEGDSLISPGGLWTPNIGQGPLWPAESTCFSWQILEGGVLLPYCLGPRACSQFLELAARVGVPPPPEIEALFLKQGGVYPSSSPFKCIE